MPVPPQLQTDCWVEFKLPGEKAVCLMCENAEEIETICKLVADRGGAEMLSGFIDALKRGHVSRIQDLS